MTVLNISGFEMVEKIGEGGMASVWKARQLSLDRIVAVKILSSRLAADSDDVKMFQGEAQAAARLKHPGIVQVYDANIEAGVYYFIMEYIAGYTVGNWIRRKGRLSESDALLVGEHVAEALGYAWENAGMIHCDIKPDNVMVDSDGTVKVADLGLARSISAMSSQSAADEVMGTPAYISPEQASGVGDLDCRTDIYSLGAMMYQILTGKLLFEGYPGSKVMEMQITETVPDPLDLNPDLSEPICRLIEKMLAKDREGRPRDWRAVQAEIARVRSGLMPEGPPPLPGASTIRRSVKRRPRDNVPGGAATVVTERRGKVQRLVGLSLLLALCIFGYFITNKTSGPSVPDVRVDLPIDTRPALSTGQTVRVEEDSRAMFESARKWAGDNPGRYDEAIGRFLEVVSQTRGTEYAKSAEEEVKKLAERKEEDVRDVLKRLENSTKELVESGQFVEAVGIYESYDGIWAADTERKRAAIARRLREAQSKSADAIRAETERRRAEAKRAEERRARRKKSTEKRAVRLLDEVAKTILSYGVISARDVLGDGLAGLGPGGRERFQGVLQLLTDAAAVDDRILATFEEQVGESLTVHLNTGAQTLAVKGVKDGKVFGVQNASVDGAVLSVDVSFGVKDLSVRERLLRMGEDDRFEVALVKGLMAFSSKAYSRAAMYFRKTHPQVAGRLVNLVQLEEQKQSGFSRQAE